MDTPTSNDISSIKPLKLPPRPGIQISKTPRINIRAVTHSSFSHRSSPNSENHSPSTFLAHSLSSNSLEKSIVLISKKQEPNSIILKPKRGTVRIQSLKLNRNFVQKSDSEEWNSDEDDIIPESYAQPLPNQNTPEDVFSRPSEMIRTSVKDFKRVKSQNLIVSQSNSDLKEILARSENRHNTTGGLVIRIRGSQNRFQNVNMNRDTDKPPLRALNHQKAKPPDLLRKSEGNWIWKGAYGQLPYI